MADVPGRSRSGVRLSGDDYQHIVTLNEALSAVHGSEVTALTVEASEAGNVDDVVLHSDKQPPQYIQIKHAVDGQTPVGTGWLVNPTRAGAKSLLRRFYESWEQLGGADHRPHLRLVTDRDIDPHDPILSMIDRRTGLVVPAAQEERARTARAGWAEHLGIDDRKLLAFLRDLHFVTGRSFDIERERATLHLDTLGLNSGQPAIDSGLALIREWVQQRERTITVGELAKMVESRLGRRAARGGLLVIEGIDDAPSAGDADVTLRFVDLYENTEAFSRRRLRDPDAWQREVWPQLSAAATALRDAGYSRVVVSGPMRLPMWFGAGSALRHVLGFNLEVAQRDQLWSSDDVGTAPPMATSLTTIGRGKDLALAVGIAADPTTEVAAHIKTDARIGRLLQITPSAGPGNESVADGPNAAAMAEAIRNHVRAALDGSIDHLHLFLAAPAGLALLLGHRWNALRPTTVYEHLGTGRGYEPTFVVPA